MKFFRHKSLKQLSIYVMVFLVIIMIGEFLILRNSMGNLRETIEKKDFARKAQLQGQQIAYLVGLYVNGENSLSPQIFASINEQENNLKILNNGGRIPESQVFISPLSKLPRITFDNLYTNWMTYREDVKNILIESTGENKDSAINETIPVESESDSITLSDSTTTTAADSIVESAIPNETLQLAASNDLIKTNAAIIKLLPGEWLTVSHWYERFLSDLSDEAENKKSALETWLLLTILFDIGLIGMVVYLFQKFTIKPIEKVTLNVAQRVQDSIDSNNEIGHLTKELNQILEQLKDATEFVAAIGEGKLDFDYKSLDSEYEEGKNRLADSLISMQAKLKALNIEEQRRQWANEGLTKFVDILRSSNDNISVLADKIISSLVKYTSSNQGGLYLLNDDDERNVHLELVSIFAFDMKKYERQKVKLGEGILGQTFLEKETTLLHEIPQEYIRITSGLGGATPKSILMVPLKVDKDVYGIVELASFNKYQPHEVAFVEKLAEAIASTLASVKVAQKNKNLIEQFQQTNEEMRSQEEEMRQNMEELQATQEELSRKEQDYIQIIKGLEQQLAEIEQSRSATSLTEQEYEFKIKSLEQKLAEAPQRGNDWALAEEAERAFRFQLEALKISEDGKTR